MYSSVANMIQLRTGRNSRVTTCLCFLFVSSAEMFFTDPVICYFLDAFLMVYCIAATALFFREKVSFSKGGPHFRAFQMRDKSQSVET